MPDLIESLQEESIQERARGNGASSSIGYSLLQFAQAGEVIAPWWSTLRDRQLRDFWKRSDHFSGALNMLAAKIAAIPFRVEPRDMSIKAHQRQAEEYQMRLYEASEFGTGYDAWATRTLLDYWTQDNGLFGEVIGDGDKDGPIEGPALGVASLDASRCQRTGDPEYPVIYRDTDGKAFKLHRSRVLFRASLSSSMAEMHGVGFCWLSRAINNVQHLVDIATYEQEKLGSRPKRAFMILGGGLAPEDVQTAVRLADEQMDSQGLARYSKMVALGSRNIPSPTLDLIDLMGVPDGFDKQTSTTLAMYAIALAGGFPPRWIWPATASGATKADAMYQHIAGQGSGVGSILTMFTLLIGGSPQGPRHMIGKFLPPHLRIVYDFQDDEQDRMVAEIKDTRAKTRETNINTGVIDVRTAREQALSAGDLTDRQFARLELEDGRLPDGGDVLQLFSSTEGIFLRLLDLGVDEPLALDLHDPADMLIAIDVAALNAQDELVTSTNVKQREKAEQALSALGKLKGMYTELVTQELQAEVEAEQAQAQPATGRAQGTPAEEGTQEQPSNQEQLPAEEQAEKGFNFGAKVGEVIRGNLARGAGGRFTNVNQMRSSMLSKLLDRLRNRRGDRLGAADQKRLENRAAVSEKLGDGLPGGVATLDGLSSIRSGDAPENADTLIGRGLAERNADGTVSMTSRGRTLLSAANSGDVDRARSALKPPPAKGGGRAKKTPEQREAERAQERADHRADVARQLPEDFVPEDFDALATFYEGGELDGNAAPRLIEDGLVEYDADGMPRLTTAGRQVASRSGQGDARATLDALSRGQERAQAQRDKADVAREQADVLDGEADEAESETDAFEIETNRRAAEMENELQDAQAAGDLEPDEVERAQARIDALYAQVQRRRAQVERLRQRAEEQRARADELGAKFGERVKGGGPPPFPFGGSLRG